MQILKHSRNFYFIISATNVDQTTRDFCNYARYNCISNNTFNNNINIIISFNEAAIIGIFFLHMTEHGNT